MSFNGVLIQDTTDTMGHKSTHITETVNRPVIVPAIRGGAESWTTSLATSTRTALSPAPLSLVSHVTWPSGHQSAEALAREPD
jgi:hypothetical protein